MKVDIKELFLRLIPTPITISGTTSSTGAIEIPTKYRGRALLGIYCNSATSLVFRRDESYLTVMYQGTGNTLVPRANTLVTIKAWVI